MPLYQLTHPTLPSEFPPLRADRGARHNLPAPLTTLIGRDEEAGAIEKLLDEHRILTLTGAGGCGKTRLAMRAGAEWLSRATADVWFADLANVPDDDLAPAAVSRAMAAREPGGDALAVATETIGDRPTLLILDNCEHLLDGCAEVVTGLIPACSRLRVLCTSREPLGLPGEAVFRVPSLAVPDSGASLAEARAADAVRLFETCGRRAAPGYEVTAGDVGSVVEICRRLDGIPLAVELAAARIRMLTARDIAERLDDVFHLLTGGGRRALPRHQTLQATIEWSYRLLSGRGTEPALPAVSLPRRSQPRRRRGDLLG